LYSTLKTKVTRCWSLSHPNKYVFNVGPVMRASTMWSECLRWRP